MLLTLSNFASVGTYARQREVPIGLGMDVSFEKFSAIFGWTGSAQLTKDLRKMLLSFESVSQCDIQIRAIPPCAISLSHARFGNAIEIGRASPRSTCETFRKNELYSTPRIAPCR